MKNNIKFENVLIKIGAVKKVPKKGCTGCKSNTVHFYVKKAKRKSVNGGNSSCQLILPSDACCVARAVMEPADPEKPEKNLIFRCCKSRSDAYIITEEIIQQKQKYRMGK